MIEQRLHPDGIEAVGAELDGKLQPAVAFAHQKRQVELRGTQIERDRLECDVSERRGGVRLLVDEHHLEDRVTVRLTRGRQRRRQHVEGQRRVGQQGFQVRTEVLDARRDLLLLVQRRGDDERVEEVADHLRRGRMRARRHRRGEGDPLAIRVAVQQQAEHERVDHERRRAGGGGEAPDARLDRSARSPLDQPTAVAPEAGGLLEGQPQVVRQGVEAPSPEREVLVTAARAGVPEPVDVVVILGDWGGVRQSPVVRLCHLLPQEGERSFVGQDVVQREQQHARLPHRFIDELHPDQRPVREVERPAGLAGGDCQCATVFGLDPLNGQRRRRVDDLARGVPVCLERGSQQPVPRHHPRERLLQPRHVQHAADAEGAA